MQRLNTRYAFDVTSTPVFGADPGLLSPAMPPMHVMDAMDTEMECPSSGTPCRPALCWKVMRRLGIGPERRLTTAQTVLREFVVKMMETGKHIAYGDFVQRRDEEEHYRICYRKRSITAGLVQTGSDSGHHRRIVI
jgi:hypothetical protein